MSEPASTAQWLAANPPPSAAFKQSLAGVARRVLAGESFDLATRELLDELALLHSDEQRRRALADEPPPTGDARHDAYLAALAEHFALRFGLERPPWVTRPERFLDAFWFKSDVAGFRAIAIAQSPAAFRRRGIFIALGARRRCGLRTQSRDLRGGRTRRRVARSSAGLDLRRGEAVFGDRLDAAARFFVEELFAGG